MSKGELIKVGKKGETFGLMSIHDCECKEQTKVDERWVDGGVKRVGQDTKNAAMHW